MSEEAKEFLNKWAVPEDPAESNSSSSDSSSSSSEGSNDEDMEDVESPSVHPAPRGRKRDEEEIQMSRPTKNRRLEHLWKPMDLMSIEARVEFAVGEEGFRGEKLGRE